MKGKILFWICLFSVRCLNSQSLVCEKLANYPLLSFSNYFSIQPNFSFNGDTILFFNEMNITVAKPNQEPVVHDLKKELSKSQRSVLAPVHGFNYFFSNNILIVRNRNHALMFLYEKNKFRFMKLITLTQKYGNRIYLAGNTLYFYEIYDRSKTNEELASGVLSYDLRSDKQEVHTFPFSCLGITHLGPNQFIDFTDSGYLVCDPLRYKIYEYDLKHVLKDSIGLADSLFEASDPRLFNRKFDVEKMGVNVVDYLEDMKAYLDTMDRVWLADYIDEHTLFVRITRNSIRPPGSKVQLFYDHVWVKKDGRWKLSTVKEISIPEKEKTVNKENLWPYFFPGSKYTGSNGILYYTLWSSSANTFPQTVESFYGFEATTRDSVSLKLIRFKVK